VQSDLRLIRRTVVIVEAAETVVIEETAGVAVLVVIQADVAVVHRGDSEEEVSVANLPAALEAADLAAVHQAAVAR